MLLLSALLLATALASITEVIEWNGVTSPSNIFLIPGDTVTWSLSSTSGGGLFGFALEGKIFSLLSSHNQTFDTPGEYYYHLTTTEHSVRGKVTVNSAQIFDETITTYELQLGQTVRWQLKDEQSILPLSSLGSPSGSSRIRNRTYDHTFLIPGSYDWFDEKRGQQYYFSVQDPDPSLSHVNIIWHPKGTTSTSIYPAGWSLRFYSSEDRRLNVHVYQQTQTGEQSVWISADLHQGGDSVVYFPDPGMYIARCDYDDTVSYHFGSLSERDAGD
jgi:plastocyanin